MFGSGSRRPEKIAENYFLAVVDGIWEWEWKWEWAWVGLVVLQRHKAMKRVH